MQGDKMVALAQITLDQGIRPKITVTVRIPEIPQLVTIGVQARGAVKGDLLSNGVSNALNRTRDYRNGIAVDLLLHHTDGDIGRIGVAADSLGLAQACFDAAANYAKTREQFGRKISKFQAIQFKLADMAVEIELARLMTYKAAWLYDQGRPNAIEGDMAKLFASESAKRAADHAVQIHGGYGFMDEFAVSRYWRTVKIMEIGEGTNEIQRLVIARRLGF